MKKSATIAVAFLVASVGAVFGNENEARWDSVYERDRLAISVGAGVSYTMNLTVFPSVEYMIASYKIDDYVPIDFGVSIRGLVSWNAQDEEKNWTWISAGGGAFGTVHLSFDNLRAHTIPYLENFDFYAALGLIYTYQYFAEGVPNTDLLPKSGIGVATVGGMSYYLLNWLALNAQVSFWSYMGSVKLGLVVKF